MGAGMVHDIDKNEAIPPMSSYICFTRWRNTSKKFGNFSTRKSLLFFPLKEHLFSGHTADIQRTSCILSPITLLIYARYRHKNDHFFTLCLQEKHKKNLAIFPQLINLLSVVS